MKRNTIFTILAAVLVLVIVAAVSLTQRKHGVMEEPMISTEMESEEMETDEMKTDEMKTDDTVEVMEVKMSEEVMMMNDGELAPDFSLMTLDGEKITLSDLKGEKVMIKFWASWCSICLSGLDEIDALTGEMNGFKVLTMVSPDHNGEKNIEDFKEWFPTRETKNLIVLLDQEGVIAKEYGVRGYPTTAFIGTDGVLVKTIPGHIDNANIISIFEDIK